MIINIETKEQYLELKSSHKEYFYNKTKAKFNCMIENNVKILLYNDIKPYIEYVNMKYGKDYIKQFKINRG